MPGVPVVTPDPHLPTVTAASSPAAVAFDAGARASVELERQLRAYAELGVLDVLGLTADDVERLIAEHAPAATTAAARLADGPAWAAHEQDAVPFVLVLPGLQRNEVVPAMRRGERAGVSVIDDAELATYRPLEDLAVPEDAYLLTGIDTGAQWCGVTPERALAAITGRGRTPLTVAEGLAMTIVRPDVLRSNRCYSLAGSRTGTNQRVPAVWISERRAKLGWCWDRNPHTWLGTASAGARERMGS